MINTILHTTYLILTKGAGGPTATAAIIVLDDNVVRLTALCCRH